MKEGDKVTLKHCDRSPFMNQEFLKFIDERKGIVFIIERVVGDVVKLKRVGFWISKDFLDMGL